MGAGTASLSETDTVDSLDRRASAENDVAAMTMPYIKNALALASLSDLNSMAANKAPRFPPAPTMPETDPTAHGRISGATAKVTPHAMHTNNPKRRKARSGRTKSCQSRKHHHEQAFEQDGLARVVSRFLDDSGRPLEQTRGECPENKATDVRQISHAAGLHLRNSTSVNELG